MANPKRRHSVESRARYAIRGLHACKDLFRNHTRQAGLQLAEQQKWRYDAATPKDIVYSNPFSSDRQP